MSRPKKTVDEMLREFLPAAAPERMESAGERVLERLKPEAGNMRREILPDTTVSRPRRIAWFAMAAAVFIAGLVAIVPNVVRRSPSPAIAELDNGASRRSIAAGEVVHADEAAGAMLVLEDGSRVEMRSQTALLLERSAEGVRIHLNSGGVIVNAAKQTAGHLYVQTKDCVVSVVGTVFLVNAEEQGSRVAVIEGQVHVQWNATERNLLAGDRIETNPQMESHPMTQQISWSRNADAYLALLRPTVVPSVAAQNSRNEEQRKSFEVVSIRSSALLPAGGGRGSISDECASRPFQLDPGRFAIRNITLYRLITIAYGKSCPAAAANDLLVGGPDWVRSDRFDVQAVIPEGSPRYTPQQLTRGEAPELQMMFQSLLAQRFNLSLHRETRQVPAYALTVAKSGVKLRAMRDDELPRPGEFQPRAADGHEQHLTQQGNMQNFADLLGGIPFIHRIVVDKTGLSGKYLFVLGWDTDDDFLGALEDQFGLKLESTKTSVELLVIERAEKPPAN